MKRDSADKPKTPVEILRMSIPGAIRQLNRRSLAQEVAQERLISRILFHNDRILFSIQEMDSDGFAAGLIASRNPIYLLGRLAPSPSSPTAKHVPLTLPCGCNEPFHHYRRLTLDSRCREQLLMCPYTRLAWRPQSFRVINRLSQALRWNPDPHYDLRARTFSAQFLKPLLASRISRVAPFRILDLGAGTGQFTLSALSSLTQSLARLPATGAIRVVDGAHRCASNQYIITSPQIVDEFKGRRLW